MAIVLPEIWKSSVDDEEAGAINISPYLDSGELVASVTVTEITTSDLTLTNKAVSTAQLTILDETVPIGEAIQFTYSGCLVGVLYKLAVQITTDSTPARVKNYCQRIQTAEAC
jgi:hypothetical protein